MKRKENICLAASAGGHLSELLPLASSWKGRDCFSVTTTEVVRDKLMAYGNVYVVGESNREHPCRVLLALFRCIGIIVKERPSVILSTGASVGCILCYLGKLIGAKIVWVDSITNVPRPSFSGRMVRPISDLFLVQWSELAEHLDNAEYAGAII